MTSQSDSTTEKGIVRTEESTMPTDSDKSSKDSVSTPEKPMHPLLWNCMILFGVFIYASYTILMHLCEVNGKIPFSSGSMVFMIEATKLCLSVSMYTPEVRQRGDCACPTWNLIIPFAIPAVLYALNNNLAVYIQQEMDPATYQVLSNFKVLTTAILFRLIIKKPISRLQWFALGILMFAGILNSYGGMMKKVEKTASANSHQHISFLGIIMISCYCFISGLSGVYTEYVLKKQPQMSIHLQNSLLYIFGVVINGVTFCFQASQFEDKSYGFNLFHGYTFITWMVILTQSITGIIMGVIMKYATNITRLFLIGSAMLVTTVLSMLIFGLQLNVYFCMSFVFVIAALYLYNM